MFEKKGGSDSVDYETHVYLKAQVDQLTGRNEELRRELRQARNECDKAAVESDKAKTKVRHWHDMIMRCKRVAN